MRRSKTSSPSGQRVRLQLLLSTFSNRSPPCYEYFAIIHVDYPKAFDTVSHSSLMIKMCTIDLSDQIYNWAVNNYFNRRGHITSHRGIMYSLARINASVIQGSMLGPPSLLLKRLISTRFTPLMH